MAENDHAHMRAHPMATMRRRLISMAAALCLFTGIATAAEQVVVGSKRFTESYILGEIVALSAGQSGATAVHKPGLGSSAVVIEALKLGSIDVYPEYLGTIEQEILKLPPGSSTVTIRQELARLGLAFSVPFGFSNSYALALTSARARQLSLQSISDLRAHPDLVIAVSQEFLGRSDGWPGLARRYGLQHKPTGMDHGVAYEALKSGRIAVTDVYTTDAKIAELGLAILEDDLGYFPRYDAVLLHRIDLPERSPAAWQRIATLEGRIDATRMISMNAEAELHGRSFAAIATDFVEGRRPGAGAPSRATFRERLFGADFARLTREHVSLVAVSLGIAVLIGIPLGALAVSRRRLGPWIFGGVGLLQTIPSLALLAALIPLLGRIGTVPAVIALSLYALLPIVRNTAAGLEQVPEGLKHAGMALGLTPAQRWRHIDLPLALPVALAGIKTAAVLTVGTATIAAFIGAGGYGERIAQGLALNDGAALLAGAVPAAVLALLTQALFEVALRLGRRRRIAGATATPVTTRTAA